MKTILLVDDEKHIRAVTRKALEREGYRVIESVDGEEALLKLDTLRPDLILLDVMMPGEDGWEVCRALKNNREQKDIPVVMFTVRTSRDSYEKSLEYAKADAQINKPFKIADLLRVVSRFIKP